MLPHLSAFTYLLFGCTALATLFLFYRTLQLSTTTFISGKAKAILAVLCAWLLLQAVLSWRGVYSSSPEAIPPKIVLFGIAPMVVTIIILFATRRGRRMIDSLPLKNLIYLHTVRIPVEIVLYLLFLDKAVPELMTFEGRNWDILAGITAPFVAYWGFTRRILSTKILLAWNIICLGLLLNIVVNALLSTPSPFQQFAFDQPNIALLYFPFSWLPAFIVPVVLFSHLAAIRQGMKS